MASVRKPASFLSPLMRVTTRYLRRLCSTPVPQPTLDPVPGSAQPEATRAFVNRSKLPLYHTFAKSRLVVNPMLIGAPKGIAGEDDEADEAIRQCVLSNRSNCIVVSSYSLQPDGQTSMWFSAEVARMITEKVVKREELVVIADLGKVSSEDEIGERLALSMHLSCMQEIDAVMVKVDSTMFDMHEPEKLNILDILEVLETFSGNEHLKFYGLHIDIPPYSYHTPPVRSISNHGYIPSELEEAIHYDLKYADFVTYQISPTTAIPATFPMLDPEEDAEGEVGDAAFVDEMGREIITEKTRKFTRIAIDPLLCFTGRAPLENNRGDGVFLSNRDVDFLVKSINTPSQTPQHQGEKMEQEGDLNVENAKLEAENEEDPSSIPEGFAREKMDLMSAVEVGSDETGDNVDYSSGVPLFSGLLEPDIESSLSDTLNELCPPLSTTPLLQDKCLRLVYSIGIDSVMIDCMTSAYIGKSNIKPNDLLPSSKTANLFGNFMVDTSQMIPRKEDEEPKKNSPY